MPKGTVEHFEPDKGMGVVRFENGETMAFDISASNKREVRAGDVAEITVGTGFSGKPRIKLLKFALDIDRAPSFADGFAQLQALGFVSDWTVDEARAAFEDNDNDVPSRLYRGVAGELCELYYGHALTEHARADSVLTVEYENEQVAKQLLALCPTGDTITISPAALSELSLGPWLAAVNAELESQRFYVLDFEHDFVLVALRDAAFPERLAQTTFLKLV